MLDSIPSRNVKGDIQLYHFPMPGLPMDAQSFANISFFAIPCSVEARTRFEYLILEDATICDVLRTSNVVHLFRFSTIPESLSIDAKKRENSSTGSAPITFLSFDVSFLQGNHFFQLAIGHIGQGGVVSTRICQIRHQIIMVIHMLAIGVPITQHICITPNELGLIIADATLQLKLMALIL